MPTAIEREPGMSNEPRININGTELNEAQCMTLRVAITQFSVEMGEPNALGMDTHGRSIAEAYRARASEIINIMITT
jgi:hypothetical protein